MPRLLAQRSVAEREQASASIADYYDARGLIAAYVALGTPHVKTETKDDRWMKKTKEGEKTTGMGLILREFVTKKTMKTTTMAKTTNKKMVTTLMLTKTTAMAKRAFAWPTEKSASQTPAGAAAADACWVRMAATPASTTES